MVGFEKVNTLEKAYLLRLTFVLPYTYLAGCKRPLALVPIVRLSSPGKRFQIAPPARSGQREIAPVLGSDGLSADKVCPPLRQPGAPVRRASRHRNVVEMSSKVHQFVAKARPNLDGDRIPRRRRRPCHQPPCGDTRSSRMATGCRHRWRCPVVTPAGLAHVHLVATCGRHWRQIRCQGQW